MARDLRRDVFQRVESFSSTEFDKFSTASLITRSTNDITQIQMVVIMMMRMVFYAPIIGVGGVIRAIGKSATMWWIIALAVVVLLGLIVTVFSIALPKFKIIQNLIDRLNLVTRENLSGMMVIRAFNMQAFEEKRFDKANADLTGTMPVRQPRHGGHDAGDDADHERRVAADHLGWARTRWRKSTMQVGDMMAFMQYAMQIVFCLPDAVDDVHHPAARLGLRRPHRRCAGDRAGHQGPAEAQAVPRAVQGHGRVPQRRPSAIPARRRMCCTTSASPPSPGRPRPSSAPPARANRPSST